MHYTCKSTDQYNVHSYVWHYRWSPCSQRAQDLRKIQIWRHIETVSLSPSQFLSFYLLLILFCPHFLPGSFPQMILDLVPMYSSRWSVCKNKHLFKVTTTPTEKRKQSLWNPITERPPLFYCYQQHWSISSMVTVSNNCSHTNSITKARLSQGVDIKLNFHLKLMAKRLTLQLG